MEVASLNTGPIAGNAYTIDTIKTPVSGWSAKAAIETLGSGPFTLADGEDLILSIDEDANDAVTFNTGDFADITNATAAEVAAVISTALTGKASAIDAGGKVRVTSDTDGSGSSVQINGGTAAAALGFGRSLFKGFNPSTPAQILSGNAETYALSNGELLFVQVDGGATQSIDFNTPDFVSIGAAEAHEVAKAINADISGAFAYVIDGKVQIESLTVGLNSRIEVTGGSANVALGFPEGALQAGTSGDADPGRNLETDAQLKLRRRQILALPGGGTLRSILSALLALEEVDQAFVFENATSVTDAQGRPPNSIEAVLLGGEEADIAQAIFDNKSAGIETYRDPGPFGRTETVPDSQGVNHDVNFNFVEEIQIYVDVDITVRAAQFGAGDTLVGEQLVKEAIKAFGDELNIGQDIVIVAFQCIPLDVDGVVDVPAIRIEDVPSPTNTANFPISDRQIASFSTADITVNVTVA